MIRHAAIVDPAASVALDFRASVVASISSGFFYTLVRWHRRPSSSDCVHRFSARQLYPDQPMTTSSRASIFFFLAFTACARAVNLSPAAEAVRVTSNPDAVKGCKFIAEVTGADRLNGGMMGQMAAEENATRFLKKNASEAGANTVLVSASTTGMSGSRKRGEAYACTAAQ